MSSEEVLQVLTETKLDGWLYSVNIPLICLLISAAFLLIGYQILKVLKTRFAISKLLLDSITVFSTLLVALLVFTGLLFDIHKSIEQEKLITNWNSETVFPYLKQNPGERIEGVEVEENKNTSLGYTIRYKEEGIYKELKGHKEIVYDLPSGAVPYAEIFKFKESIGQYHKVGDYFNVIHLSEKLAP